MTERLMGIETEYAFTAHRKDGTLADPDQAMSKIEQIAERRLPHLRAQGQRGVFLRNASRFYRDAGNHQEFATPECPNPWDAVRYVVANEQILLGLTNELLKEDSELGEALYFKHNVDYSGAGTSWGTHESYLTRSPILSLPDPLLPHFASRVIYTGAGGFDPLTSGVKFMVSPRAAHLTQTISADTQNERPLFNTRDEPLAGNGYRRLHVICGESLSSHTSMWLRSATTSLIVALADAGADPGRKVSLVEPVGAMNTFSRDPFCRAKVLLADGTKKSAIEIQRHYLEVAEKNIDSDFMPPWAPDVCKHWRRLLDLLDQGAPDSVSTILDWAIKYSLFKSRAERNDMDWEKLQRCRRSRKFESLRQELFEVDVRFGQLGDLGVFAQLDRAGVLQHEFPGVDNFPHAIIHPPDLGRARLRGRAIQKLWGQDVQNSADWHGVWDSKNGQWLDLSEPFESAEEWKPIKRNRTEPVFSDPAVELGITRIEQLCHRGRFEEAHLEIQNIEAEHTLVWRIQHARLTGLKSVVQARRGQTDAIDYLELASSRRRITGERLAKYLLALRFSGLVPSKEVPNHLREKLDRLSRESLNRLPFAYREYTGVLLTLEGKLLEAAAILEGGINESIGETPGLNRRRAALANVKRLMGDTEESELLLKRACDSQRTFELEGDLVDLTLPNLAKLASADDPSAAAQWLSEAKSIQIGSRNRLGLVRTLLLEARLAALRGATPHNNEAILAISRKAPALGECRLFQEINDRWEEWSRDPNAQVNGDVFWGL